MHRNETRISRREGAGLEVRLVTPTSDVTVRVSPTRDRRRIYTSMPIHTKDPSRSMSRQQSETYQRQALEAVAPEVFGGEEYALRLSSTGDWVAYSEAPPDTGRMSEFRMTANVPRRYYVWVLSASGHPLKNEGPYGPFDMDTAKTTARIRATKGRHDYAVTRGSKFSSSNTVRRYANGTGESF